jgi:hypothetical protein
MTSAAAAHSARRAGRDPRCRRCFIEKSRSNEKA